MGIMDRPMVPYEWSDESDGGRVATHRARRIIRLDSEGNAVVTPNEDDHLRAVDVQSLRREYATECLFLK